MGTIGFGKLAVNGLNRVPNPPAIITALISVAYLWNVAFNS